jgi:pyruvate dehydrogenase E2 component (dihydrolipoamide acetyltransferase)
MTVFKLPDLGEGLSEAEVVRWHVQVGERIAVDRPLLAVETAKAVVEVPSPVSGTVTALYAQPGDRVETGAPLVQFEAETAATAGSTPAEAAGAATAAGTASADAGTVVGAMPDAAASAEYSTQLGAGERPSGPRVRAVPAARALARSLGLDLTGLQGHGRDGLITLQDVIGAGIPATARAGSKLRPTTPHPPPGDGTLQELRSLRRAMAHSMEVSRDSVMECTVVDDADLHHWHAGDDYTVRVLRAIAVGCQAEPGLNAWYDAESESRRLFEHVDVGIAVDTADGLLVPVIRDVNRRPAAELRVDLDRLKREARERTIRSEELRNFTFMLSNFGMMAGRYASPVVVPPAVAILGTGRVRDDVVSADGRVEVHRRMPLSLTFDHRVVTGGEAVRFLGALIADLESPQ